MFKKVIDIDNECINKYKQIKTQLESRLNSKINEDTLVANEIVESLRKTEKIAKQKKVEKNELSTFLPNKEKSLFSELGSLLAEKATLQKTHFHDQNELIEDLVFKTMKPDFEIVTKKEKVKLCYEENYSKLETSLTTHLKEKMLIDIILCKMVLKNHSDIAFVKNLSDNQNMNQNENKVF